MWYITYIVGAVITSAILGFSARAHYICHEQKYHDPNNCKYTIFDIVSLVGTTTLCWPLAAGVLCYLGSGLILAWIGKLVWKLSSRL